MGRQNLSGGFAAKGIGEPAPPPTCSHVEKGSQESVKVGAYPDYMRICRDPACLTGESSTTSEQNKNKFGRGEGETHQSGPLPRARLRVLGFW